MDKEPKLDAEALVELGKNLEEMCAEYRFGYCFGCPFRGDGDLFFCDKSSFTNRTAEDWQKVLAAVEKWRNRDRSKRIDPTECVRVYTLEVTDIVKDGQRPFIELPQNELERSGRVIAAHIQKVVKFDDVKCVKAQQFVTKWREVE